MNPRYLDLSSAFEPGVFRNLSVFIAAVFISASALIGLLNLSGKLSAKKSEELKLRMISWAILIAAIGLPIICGSVLTMIGTTLLSML